MTSMCGCCKWIWKSYLCLLFCTFLSRRCTIATWNFLNSRARFMEYGNKTQKFSFSFSKLWDSTPENFANVWEIKRNWIESMKFATVRMHSLRALFRLLSTRNFVTMATWRNGFSSLLDGSHEKARYQNDNCQAVIWIFIISRSVVGHLVVSNDYVS